MAGVSGDLASRLRAGALGHYREEVACPVNVVAQVARTVNSSAQTTDGVLTGVWHEKHGADLAFEDPKWGVCRALFQADGGTHQCHRPGNHERTGHRCRCCVSSPEKHEAGLSYWESTR